MKYEVLLDEFEGPLDLLLHLIKESKVDIWDISIEDVTKQYLDYINKMEELNLNVASEYLVMASELLEIKSKMLLPRVKDDDEEEEELDPREALVKKLIEYEQYKRLSEDFKKLELIRKEIYTKTPESLKEYADPSTEIVTDVSLDDMMIAFQKFLERKKFQQPLETSITKKEISVEERSFSIKKILTNKRQVEFTELFDVLSKEYIVVTFLAILEMAKKHELIISQDKTFSTIMIEGVN